MTFRRRIEPFLAYEPGLPSDSLALYANEWHSGQPISVVRNAEPVILRSGEDALLFHVRTPDGDNTEDYAAPREALDGFPGFYIWDPKLPED